MARQKLQDTVGKRTPAIAPAQAKSDILVEDIRMIGKRLDESMHMDAADDLVSQECFHDLIGILLDCRALQEELLRDLFVYIETGLLSGGIGQHGNPKSSTAIQEKMQQAIVNVGVTISALGILLEDACDGRPLHFLTEPDGKEFYYHAGDLAALERVLIRLESFRTALEDQVFEGISGGRS